jgi:hypothetical protein
MGALPALRGRQGGQVARRGREREAAARSSMAWDSGHRTFDDERERLCLSETVAHLRLLASILLGRGARRSQPVMAPGSDFSSCSASAGSIERNSSTLSRLRPRLRGQSPVRVVIRRAC